MPADQVCPNCGTTHTAVFYEIKRVPVHSVLLVTSRDEALNYPSRDIVLAFCRTCGFIYNTAFDPRVHTYAPGYEATQAFSLTFNAFQHTLAARLVEQYDLHGKDIVEIGCGLGEFLSLLCELGDNRGVGFDPAYVDRRSADQVDERATFICDFYSEKYAHYRADFVCCKMTLEHIPQVAEFVGGVRRSLGDCSSQAVVFFQVPDVTRILRELAFWDIYYEHCSYFSPASLARLFRRCGFEVVRLAREYGQQYLMIEARVSDAQVRSDEGDDDVVALQRDVAHFAQNYMRRLETWRCRLQDMRRRGQRVVIWGAGSKAVAFLTTLDVREDVEYAVDVNPYRQGTYMVGTGQPIVPPSFLQEYRPDVVIAMNPVYCAEIEWDLQRMDVAARLVTV